MISITRATTDVAKSILSLNPDNVSRNNDNVVYDNTTFDDFSEDFSFLNEMNQMPPPPPLPPPPPARPNCNVIYVADAFRKHFAHFAHSYDELDSWPMPYPKFHYDLKNTWKHHKNHCHLPYPVHPATGKCGGYVIAITLIFHHRSSIVDYHELIRKIQTLAKALYDVAFEKKASKFRSAFIEKHDRNQLVLSKNLKYL